MHEPGGVKSIGVRTQTKGKLCFQQITNVGEYFKWRPLKIFKMKYPKNLFYRVVACNPIIIS